MLCTYLPNIRSLSNHNGQRRIKRRSDQRHMEWRPTSVTKTCPLKCAVRNQSDISSRPSERIAIIHHSMADWLQFPRGALLGTITHYILQPCAYWPGGCPALSRNRLKHVLEVKAGGHTSCHNPSVDWFVAFSRVGTAQHLQLQLQMHPLCSTLISYARLIPGKLLRRASTIGTVTVVDTTNKVASTSTAASG